MLFSSTGLFSQTPPTEITFTYNGNTTLTATEVATATTGLGATEEWKAIIDEGFETIGYAAFYTEDYLVSVEFPTTLKFIGEGAFANCARLTGTLVFPDLLETIGDYAFQFCDIRTLTFSPTSTLKTIGNHAFQHCNITSYITFPASLETILLGAFYSCTNIIRITFPYTSQIKLIDNMAFGNCTSLNEVRFYGTTLPNIGSANFTDLLPAGGSTVYHVSNQAMKDILMASPYNIPYDKIYILYGLKDGVINSLNTPFNITTTTQPTIGFDAITDDMPDGTYQVTFSIYDSKSKLIYTETKSFVLPLPYNYLEMEFLEGKKFVGDGLVIAKIMMTGPDDYKVNWTIKFGIKSGYGIDSKPSGIYAKEK